jgi:hypothetical protein
MTDAQRATFYVQSSSSCFAQAYTTYDNSFCVANPSSSTYPTYFDNERCTIYVTGSGYVLLFIQDCAPCAQCSSRIGIQIASTRQTMSLLDVTNH